MKNFIAAIFVFLTIRLSAQTNINKGNIVFSTDLTAISYAPETIISKSFYSMKKFVNGKEGIEFSFLIKPVKDMPQVNLDSIILTSSDFKILAIHKPIFDTTYSLMDITLSYNTVHSLDDLAIRFLKEEMISDITLYIDNSPVTIRLNKKSQMKLNRDAKLNY
jgi:hypothetical protein